MKPSPNCPTNSSTPRRRSEVDTKCPCPEANNQPAFSPDGKYILYSRYDDDTKQSDIYKYDLTTKTTTQFTKTPTSEYSPTFMPDGKNISIVMVEKDSVQRLWKFPLGGGEPVCIMKNIPAIGYYCWINKDSIAIYVLTKPSFTIQVADIRTQKATVVADSAGRCMRMKSGLLWYTTRLGILNTNYEYHPRTKKSLLQGSIENEDYFFYNKTIWSCSDNSIMSGYMSGKSGAAEVANLSKFGITKITRITLSPDGKKIAVVSNK